MNGDLYICPLSRLRGREKHVRAERENIMDPPLPFTGEGAPLGAGEGSL
jgi:hypothetical protein